MNEKIIIVKEEDVPGFKNRKIRKHPKDRWHRSWYRFAGSNPPLKKHQVLTKKE